MVKGESQQSNRLAYLQNQLQDFQNTIQLDSKTYGQILRRYCGSFPVAPGLKPGAVRSHLAEKEPIDAPHQSFEDDQKAMEEYLSLRRRHNESHLESYAVAVQEGWVKDFVADLACRYHKRYPASLAHDKEPTKEHLAAVNDDAPDPETMYPLRRAGESDEEFETAVREHELLKEITRFRVAQIGRWMKYHYEKSCGIKSKDNPFSKLMTKLTGSSLAEPKRRKRAYDLWAQAHPEKVEELMCLEQLKLDAGKEEQGVDVSLTSDGGESPRNGNPESLDEVGEVDKGNEESSKGDESVDDDDGKKGKKGKGKGKKKKMTFLKKGENAFVRVQQDVIKKVFDNLPPDERKPWEEAVEQDWEQHVAAYKASLDAGFSTEPQARQDCISRLPSFAQPILDGIREATGMHCTLLVGGPEPADMGRLNLVSFHSGETLSIPALNFGEACQEGYRKLLIPLYGSYLRKCFTVEECKSRALPDKGLSLEAVLSAEVGVNFDALETPGIPRDTALQNTADSGTGSSGKPATQAAPRDGKDTRGGSGAKDSSQQPSTRSKKAQSSKDGASKSHSDGDVPTEVTSSPAGGANPDSSAVPSSPAAKHSPVPSPCQTPARRLKTVSPTSPISSPPFSPPLTVPPSTPPAASSPLYPPSPTGSIATIDLDIPPIEPDEEPADTLPIQQDEVPDEVPVRGTAGPIDPGVEERGRKRSNPDSLDTIGAVRSQPKRAKRGSKTASIPASPSSTAPAPTSASPRAASNTVQSKRKINAAGSSRASKIVSTPALPLSTAPAPISASAPATSNSEHPKTRSKRKVNGAGSSEQHPKKCAKGNRLPAPLVLPPDAPAYVQNLITMVKDTGMSERFQETITRYLRLEEKENYQGIGLKTSNRPDEVPQWYKRRRAVWYPKIEDLARFAQEFKSWFGTSSPPWRMDKGRSWAMVKRKNGDWDCLRVLGPNGIVAFLVALVWWQKAIKGLSQGENALPNSRLSELQSRFDAMFEEVEYTFESL
ncbi:SERTA domain-containing protein 3 [Paramarasmius palmivorus]|uniref:SERTA domain-containing protein 3 n=1 Tax=Paramarasmius palmivorus TaxID=297713 RepID=A0AAW0BEQ7_9AGAR